MTPLAALLLALLELDLMMTPPEQRQQLLAHQLFGSSAHDTCKQHECQPPLHCCTFVHHSYFCTRQVLGIIADQERTNRMCYATGALAMYTAHGRVPQ